MALARCSDCGCPNGKGDNTYSRGPHLPVSFPECGVICGRTGCDGSGYVWLTSQEETKYELGERVFPLTGGHTGAKFRVQSSLLSMLGDGQSRLGWSTAEHSACATPFFHVQ